MSIKRIKSIAKSTVYSSALSLSGLAMMVQQANPAGNMPVPNGSVPCEGTKILPFQIDFSIATGANAYLLDFTNLYQQKQFVTLQTVWIDNSTNKNSLSLVCSTSGQVVTAPPLSQGYYTLHQPTPAKITAQTTQAAGLNINLTFLNFYIPPMVWTIAVTNAAGLPQIDIPALDAVIVGGLVQVQSIPPTTGAMTDVSGTITTGGTAQQILALSATRKRWIVKNPKTATETLFISFGLGTNGRIGLEAGEVWNETGSEIIGDAVFLEAATTGHAFVAYTFG